MIVLKILWVLTTMDQELQQFWNWHVFWKGLTCHIILNLFYFQVKKNICWDQDGMPEDERKKIIGMINIDSIAEKSDHYPFALLDIPAVSIV